MFERFGVDGQIAIRTEVGPCHSGQNLSRLLVANAGAQQSVDGVEEYVLCFPTDGVERERDAHGGTVGVGFGAVFCFNFGGVAGQSGEVTTRVDVAVEHRHAHIGQHHVGGDQTFDGHRGGGLRRGCVGRGFGEDTVGRVGFSFLFVEQRQSLIGQQSHDAGGATGQQFDIAPHFELGLVNQGQDRAAHIVAHQLRAQGGSAFAAHRRANAGHDARGVTGFSQQIAAHIENRIGAKTICPRLGLGRQQHVGPRADQVRSQYQAHGSTAGRADTVLDGGVDFGHVDGRQVQVFAHVQLGVGDFGTGQG